MKQNLCACLRNIPGTLKETGERVRESAEQTRRLSSLSGSAMLAALSVVLGRFTIFFTPTLRLGFSFIATAAAGMLYGPVLTGLMGVVVDLLRYFIIGGGPYFPGFTLNEFLVGFIYGLFLYRRTPTIGRVLGAELSIMLLVHFLLNPLWLSMLYGDAFIALLSARVVKNLVMLPIKTALLYVICKRVVGLRLRRLA